jgi:hypothetical protein
MKLFYQLTEKEQNEVLHHCANMVIQDMIEDGIKLEPVTEEEFGLKDKLENAIKYIKQFSTKEEKTNYLMENETVSKAIYDIALEMAKSAFYHDDEELVIYPNSLKFNSEGEEENQIPKSEDMIPAVNTKKSKKTSVLN